jgi:hypothetical protein
MVTLADIQAKAQAGSFAEAEALLRGFLTVLFDLDIASITIRKDTLSLNSVNGFVKLAKPDSKTGSTALFFKFHHEESEEGLAEYYNSQMLSDAGFPVEKPVYVSKEVGKQVLLYPLKTSERMADVCKRIESGTGAAGEDKSVIAAQERMDKAICEHYISSLHEAPAGCLPEEPILQLFYYRLVDDKQLSATELIGRYKSFYAGKTFELPGDRNFSFEVLSKLKWRINGVVYQETLEQAFLKALKILSPAAEPYSAVIAHGDAHNGNVWYNNGAPPSLSLFDPAFAGKHVPALLAEIKPTFHNIFAHPLWLYDSKEADAGLDIAFDINDGIISVTNDWHLSELRAEFLRSKRDNLWKPLLQALQTKKMLPENWQDYMRSALFCCPTLVMNLRANAGTSQNSHTPKTSLLGLSLSMMLSSPPSQGSDIISDFFSDLNHAIISA